MSLRLSAYVWSITTYYVIQPYYWCLSPKLVFSRHFSCQKHLAASSSPNLPTKLVTSPTYHLTIWLNQKSWFCPKNLCFGVVLMVPGVPNSVITSQFAGQPSLCVSTNSKTPKQSIPFWHRESKHVPKRSESPHVLRWKVSWRVPPKVLKV